MPCEYLKAFARQNHSPSDISIFVADILNLKSSHMTSGSQCRRRHVIERMRKRNSVSRRAVAATAYIRGARSRRPRKRRRWTRESVGRQVASGAERSKAQRAVWRRRQQQRRIARDRDACGKKTRAMTKFPSIFSLGSRVFRITKMRCKIGCT